MRSSWPSEATTGGRREGPPRRTCRRRSCPSGGGSGSVSRLPSRSNGPQLEPGGVYCPVRYLESDERQRPPGRAGDRSAARGFEITIVTRTVEFALVQVRYNRTRQVRAFLAVGHVPPGAERQGQARLVRVRVTEFDHPLRLQLGDGGDSLSGKRPLLPQPAGGRDPALADGKRPAGQNQELDELPAGDVVVLRNVGREIPPPRRLVLEAPAVGIRSGLVAVGRIHDRSSAGIMPPGSTASAINLSAGRSCMAAVTFKCVSRFSFGTIMLTLVVTVWFPNRNWLVGRDRFRIASTSWRGP